MNSSDIKKEIKKNGYRITKARSAIIEIFCITEHPINAQYIQTKLPDSQITVNKTTVYRELQFLVDRNLIKPVHLTPDTLSYELVDRAHHHHIVCNNCGKIEDVILPTEKFLDDVKKQTNFELHSHSLEFYGQCTACK
jgi:Fe2+ or Zn2+ uptake regulation protein